MQGCMVRRAAAAVFFFAASSAAFAAKDPNPIPNFHQVEDGIFRGGTPGDAGVAYLKALGVRTIVNLDDRAAANREELAAAAAAGIREVALPMSGFWKPHDATVNAALAALDDPSLRPIYVHCQHGQDRTGLVVGLYRVETEHWQPGHAYAEMKQLGFHPILVFLNHYYEERTGFED